MRRRVMQQKTLVGVILCMSAFVVHADNSQAVMSLVKDEARFVGSAAKTAVDGQQLPGYESNARKSTAGNERKLRR